MAISYPLSHPTAPGFRQFSLAASNIVGISASPFSGQQQVYLWPGEWWEASVDLPAMQRASAETWLAFLLALRGPSGTFLLGDPAATAPRGSIPGTPVVDGAGQTGTSLATRGWTASQTGILLKGDYLQIGSGTTQRLYKVLGDYNSDATGKATLDIFPRLRESPADGASIVTSNAKGIFRLQDIRAEWTVDLIKTYGIAFKALEAF